MLSTEEQREMDRLKAVNEGLRKQIKKKDESLKQIESWTRNPREYQPSLYSLNHLCRQALGLDVT